jgi:hypothetical protein
MRDEVFILENCIARKLSALIKSNDKFTGHLIQSPLLHDLCPQGYQQEKD